jgi:hypothetical protein
MDVWLILSHEVAIRMLTRDRVILNVAGFNSKVSHSLGCEKNVSMIFRTFQFLTT